MEISIQAPPSFLQLAGFVAGRRADPAYEHMRNADTLGLGADGLGLLPHRLAPRQNFEVTVGA